MKLNGWGVIAYCCFAIIAHIGFIVYVFINRPIDCSRNFEENISFIKFEVLIIWLMTYFPLLIFCAFYTLLFRMCRSFLCSCWECCGNDVNGKNATGFKICFEGIFGNPLIFIIIFIAWGIYEWLNFKNCTDDINYTFLGDLCIISISLLLLCIYYFVRVKRRFKRKRDANIAKKYNEQQENDKKLAGYIDDNEGDGIADAAPQQQLQPLPQQVIQPIPNEYNIAAPPSRLREGSGAPQRRFSAQPQRANYGQNIAPAYAASAHGIAPYQPGMYMHNVQGCDIYKFCVCCDFAIIYIFIYSGGTKTFL